LVGGYSSTHSLFDPHLLWWSGPRFVLAGFEQIERDGQTLQCAQSWLCFVEEGLPPAEDAEKNSREARRAAASLRN